MMNWKTRFFDHLSNLVLYPGDGYRTALSHTLQTAWKTDSAAAVHLTAFARELDQLSETELQERFVQTFEHNPNTALELGWHVYGERYERGSLMVALRQSLAAVDVPENSELPDHLSHVLRLLPRADCELADHLVKKFLVPSLEKIEAALANPGSKEDNSNVDGAGSQDVESAFPDAVMLRQARQAGPVFLPLLRAVRMACEELCPMQNSGVEA